MKKYLLSVFLIFGLAFFVGAARAQTDEEIAAKYGVTFPIAELGNCANLTECRNFCEDPVNKDACIGFAKSKGFYTEEEHEVNQNALNKAKQILGCDSFESCRTFCEEPVNYDKCHAFAQNAGLAGGYTTDPAATGILNQAKEAFGCDSYESCRNFCENPANRDKCSRFAQEAGVKGGYEYKGPGGCTTKETCQSFCEKPDNASTCQAYSVSKESSSQNLDPAAECSRYGCSWAGNYCNCSSDTNSEYFERMKAECSKYPGCSWSGDHCVCSAPNIDYSTYSADPATECAKYSGCIWKDNWCQCGSNPTYTGSDSGGGGYPTPYPGSSGSYSFGNMMSREQQESACRAGGGTCTWSNDVCNCQGYNSSGTGSYATPYPTYYATPYSQSTSDPATACAQTSGCSWNGSSCQCSSTGGSSGSTSPTQAPTTTGSDPAAACTQTAGCSWDGSSCQCASVQGSATVFFKTWWQRLFDLFRW